MDKIDIHTALRILAGIASFVAMIIAVMKKPPMPFPKVKGGYPFLGQVFDMMKGSPWDSLQQWADKFGPTYVFHLFGSDCLSVADPELLKVILHSKLSVFKKDTAFTYKPFMVLLGKGIVTSDGAEWRRQRTHLSSALRIDILEVIPAMTIKAVKRLCVKLDAAKASGEPVEMAEEFRHLTLQVIGEAVLSISPEESDATFAKMYLPIVTEGNMRVWDPSRYYLPTPAWFQHQRDVKVLNDYVCSIITARWEVRCKEAKQGSSASPRVRDLLDKVLESYTAETFGSGAIEQVRDEVKTFILAGHETSASMLTWALYELSRSQNEADPRWNHMQKLVAETKVHLKDHLSSDGREVLSCPPRSTCDHLDFAESCLRESLRRYNAIPTVVRMVAEDVHFEGGKRTPKGTIPKDTTVMINIQGVHHNPEFWPEPLRYDPHRFMGGMDKITPYTFLPFIEGPRMCMGQFLALLESKLVISLLCTRYKFTVANPTDAGQTHKFMVPIIPGVGHFMKIT
jgi:beta-ring hydroxylase